MTDMKQFIRSRFNQLGITQSDFMEKIGVKRDLHTKRKTMENKFKDLNEFYSHLGCEVIIIEKKEKYKQLYP